MIDNLEPEKNEQINTTFLEERTTITDQAKPDMSMKLPADIERRMPDATWFARNQLMKPIQINQVAWTTSIARGTTIATYDFPEIYNSLAGSLPYQTLSMYAYFKLSPIFKFQLNSTQFHQGKLLITWDPFHQAMDARVVGSNVPIFNIYYGTGLPNVTIMASESDAAELHVPYVHPRSFLSTNSANGFDVLGRVRVTVMNPLSVATGTSTSLTLTTWVYGADAEVHVPMQTHTPITPTLRAIATGGKQSEKPSTGSSIGNLISKGTNLIGNVESGNYGAALRNGQGAIDDLGDIFGFDYPTNPQRPLKTISPVENTAVVKGSSRSHRLAMDSLSGYEPPESAFGKSCLDMDFKKIMTTPMLLGQRSWSTSMAAQALLFTLPVTPNIGCLNAAGDGVNLTYLAYLSRFFCFWRGGIEYTIEIVATRYHSGKLLIAFQPNVVTDPAYNDAARALPNLTLDIQQTSKFSFVVPFVSQTPMKFTKANNLETIIDEVFVGGLAVYIQNTLAAASNVSGTIEMNIYINAAPDFQFFTPRSHEILTVAPVIPAVEPASATGGEIELQVQRMTDSGKSSTASLTLGSGFAPKINKFGEEYSMLDLIRRFGFSTALAPTGQNTLWTVNPAYFTFNPVTASLQEVDNTHLAGFSLIYSIWAGSIRYKLVTSSPRTTDNLLYVSHQPDGYLVGDINPTSLAAFGGYASMLTTLAQDNCLEVEIPYYSPYDLLLTKPDSDNNGGFFLNPTSNGSFAILFASPSTAAFFRVMIAAGDDFRYGYLRAPPCDYNRQNGLGIAFYL